MMRRIPDKNLAVFIDTLDAMVVAWPRPRKTSCRPPSPDRRAGLLPPDFS